LEEDGKVCKGDEVSTYLAVKFLTESGVVNPKVGKSSKLSRLKHFSMSGEENMSMLSSFKLVSKEEYSTRNSSKSSFLYTSAEGKESLLDITTGIKSGIRQLTRSTCRSSKKKNGKLFPS
jgi:hypothetical protein